MSMNLLEQKIEPDFNGFLKCIRREEEPKRVYFAELFLDPEIVEAVARRFDIAKGLNPADPFFIPKRDIALYRFLGYDMFRISLPGFEFPIKLNPAGDDATRRDQARASRDWVDERAGPIQSWDDFERYPWPRVSNVDTRLLEWYEKNLPENMAIYELTAHVLENVTWAVGYESLCYMMYDQPDLVEAICAKVGELYLQHARLLCQFSRIGVIWGSDDMGFKTQPLLSPENLRRLILPWHKKIAEAAHASGKLYFLHACGNLDSIMEDLIGYVKIDAKHSFEDAIEPVTEAKRNYGCRIGLIGGIDMDILCRGSEGEIRRRVRETLDVCQRGGGYCLGSGNTIANYMPAENYLAMLDEGRKYSGL